MNRARLVWLMAMVVAGSVAVVVGSRGERAVAPDTIAAAAMSPDPCQCENGPFSQAPCGWGVFWTCWTLHHACTSENGGCRQRCHDFCWETWESCLSDDDPWTIQDREECRDGCDNAWVYYCTVLQEALDTMEGGD